MNEDIDFEDLLSFFKREFKRKINRVENDYFVTLAAVSCIDRRLRQKGKTITPKQGRAILSILMDLDPTLCE